MIAVFRFLVVYFGLCKFWLKFLLFFFPGFGFWVFFPSFMGVFVGICVDLSYETVVFQLSRI